MVKQEKRIFDNGDWKIGAKLAVYRTEVITALLYDAETWTIHRRDLKSLEKFYHGRIPA